MPSFWIRRDFEFTARHHVALALGHCSSLHEHEFAVRVTLTAPLDHRGMVLDFYELDPFGEVLGEHYDGAYLNDTIDQPTSENIARALIDELHKSVPATQGMRCSVEVSEAPGVWAGCSDD